MVLYLSASREGKKKKEMDGRDRAEAGRTSERFLKKFLTNREARGKLNEFAPEGVNELEKDENQADSKKKLRKNLKKVLDKRKRKC